LELLSINGQLLYRMIVSGANSLENNKTKVNSLNVFPVPDGDTGTNMSMTMMSAVREIQKVKEHTVQGIAEAAANGSLMGARGNSGVILSQLLRGFSKGVKDKDSLNSKELAAALKEGANTAYKAVMKPTEGTILTVAREASEKAVELSKNISDINILADKVYEYAQSVLAKTPEMLPVLKKAGVVDAGGEGLMCIFKGMIEVLKDNDIAVKGTKDDVIVEEFKAVVTEEDIEFGYCTEFIIKNADANVEELREKLSAMGDSLMAVGGAGVIKVHIHTNNPGEVLSHALALGELSKIKIDNMREQHRSILYDQNDSRGNFETFDENAEGAITKKSGIITVAMGDGIKNIFMDLGADRVIEGGQTMNPSTEDILNAINDVNATDVYILPNNGNIVMAAKQAATLSDKNIIVIPTKSIPQGIAALTVFNPDNDSNENSEIMTSTIGFVKSGQVTYAVRNTVFDNREIKEGDILGLINGKIDTIGDNVFKVTASLVDNMVAEDDELITILYGNDVYKNDVDNLMDGVKKKYPDCDVQLYYGGQPIYYFIISVE